MEKPLIMGFADYPREAMNLYIIKEQVKRKQLNISKTLPLYVMVLANPTYPVRYWKQPNN